MKQVTAKSFFGCGTNIYGWRPASAGRHIVTRWITIVFFPIVPVRSYVIDFTKDLRSTVDCVLPMLGIVRDAVEGEPLATRLCWAQVINTYLYVYLPWAIALCFGSMVPGSVSAVMATVILASWFYAAIMMRRAFRRQA